MELTDRHVLVTGASRGIGAALAEALPATGARVSVVARSEPPLRELAERIGGAAFPADLSDRAQVSGLVATIEAQAGPVDVLVNNAAISHVGFVLDRSAEDIDELFAVNLLAPVQLCQQVLPGMLARGAGHIVNMSSMAGVLSPPGLAHYAASKAGLGHYTAVLRQDLRGLPVGLTLVQLGSVPTGMDDRSREYGPIKRVADRSKGRDIVPLSTVVAAVVDAIRTGRRHVRLPRQFALLPALVEVPRRLSERIFTVTREEPGPTAGA